MFDVQDIHSVPSPDLNSRGIAVAVPWLDSSFLRSVPNDGTKKLRRTIRYMGGGCIFPKIYALDFR